MPALETIVADARLDAMARQAKVLRLQDRIAQYRAKLERGNLGSKDISAERERQTLTEAIEKWEQELREPEAQPTTQSNNTLAAIVQQLKAELALLTAKVGKSNEPVAEPQAPANA